MAQKLEIVKLDQDGHEVGRYNSAREAAVLEGISEDKLYKMLSGKKKKPINGYFYRKTGIITNAVDRIGSGKFKCPYCERRFETYNGLSKHVIRERAHGDVTQEDLLTVVKYDGIRPKCKCGCGEYTKIAHEGGFHFVDYVKGHHNRVHNNWGHNDEAKRKSAETRRKQYASGERKQWNYGKKWVDTFTEEQIEDIKKRIFTKERAKKISEKLKRPKDEKWKESLRAAFNKEEYRSLKRREMHNRIANGTFSLTSSGETEFIQEVIKPLGLEYDTQYYISDIKHYCDVYIPSKNTIIEYDGDFWHCNPEKFPNGPKFEYQVKHMLKDEAEREYCEKNGINLVRVWENDFKKRKEMVVENINTALSL